MVRRKKTTIFLDAKESTSVLELKKMIEGILKSAPENQKLIYNDIELENSKTLSESGLSTGAAKAQSPATIGLAIRDPLTHKFEPLEITKLSDPPELPDVMKGQDPQAGSTSTNEQAA